MAQVVGTRRAHIRPVRVHAGKNAGILREVVHALSASLWGSKLQQNTGAHRMLEPAEPGRHLA